MTKVIHCTCRHKYQDGRYGPGNRLANYVPPKIKGSPGGWRCTVCTDMRAREKNAKKK